MLHAIHVVETCIWIILGMYMLVAPSIISFSYSRKMKKVDRLKNTLLLIGFKKQNNSTEYELGNFSVLISERSITCSPDFNEILYRDMEVDQVMALIEKMK